MSTTHPIDMGTTHIQAERPADRKSLGASLIGQLLEWFEWSSYAVFAPFIAAAFFDKSDPTSALLATFGVFAVGFLVRPLGGIIFGRVADRVGRKNVLMITIIIMALSAVIIGAHLRDLRCGAVRAHAHQHEDPPGDEGHRPARRLGPRPR